MYDNVTCYKMKARIFLLRYSHNKKVIWKTINFNVFLRQWDMGSQYGHLYWSQGTCISFDQNHSLGQLGVALTGLHMHLSIKSMHVIDFLVKKHGFRALTLQNI